MGVPVIPASQEDDQRIAETRRRPELQFRRGKRQSQRLLSVRLSTVYFAVKDQPLFQSESTSSTIQSSKRLRTTHNSNTRTSMSLITSFIAKDTFAVVSGTARGPEEACRSRRRLWGCSRASRAPGEAPLCWRPRSLAGNTPLGSTPRTPPLKQQIASTLLPAPVTYPPSIRAWRRLGTRIRARVRCKGVPHRLRVLL